MRCLYCQQEIEKSLNLISFFLSDSLLCSHCQHKLVKINKFKMIRGISVYALYEYNDFFETLIKQYKESGDSALSLLFQKDLKQLKRKYPNHKVIIPDSSKNKQFQPLSYLLKDFEIIECFRKKKNYKQSLKNKKQRHLIQENLSLKFAPNEKEVLFFDDVVTSGYTLFTCVTLLQQQGIKVIPITLSLHRNHDE